MSCVAPGIPIRNIPNMMRYRYPDKSVFTISLQAASVKYHITLKEITSQHYLVSLPAKNRMFLKT